MYTITEICDILKNCKTINEVEETAKIVGKYRKSFCLDDLYRIKMLLNMKRWYIKKIQNTNN